MPLLPPSLRLLLPVLPLFAFGASACVTFSTPLSAEPLRAGEVEAGGSASFVHSPGHFQDTVRPWFPTGELSVRFGVADGHEVGAKLYSVGASVLTRHALLRPAEGEDGFSLSVEPHLSAFNQLSFGGAYGGGTKLVPQLSVYAGQRLGVHEVLLAARLTDFIHLNQPLDTLHQPYLGGALAYSVKVGGTMRVGAYVSYMHPLVRIRGYQDAPILQAGPLLSGTWSTVAGRYSP